MGDLGSPQRGKQKCILYHHPLSICSLMVRYTFAVAGAPYAGEKAIDLDEQTVDIFDNKHLEEFYLCQVNPKGQVPALTSPGYLARPITDSLDITLWACERYPTLRPEAHRQDIDRLLRDLHAINFFSLSFNKRPGLARQFTDGVEQRLARHDISTEYRRALERKLQLIKTEKVDGLLPAVVEVELKRAQTFLAEIEAIKANSTAQRPNRPSRWIFGGDEPTALDTSLLVFLVRMQDVGRIELIPSGLLPFVTEGGADEVFRGVYNALHV